MGIIDEYKVLCAEYESKYGPRTAVLMQIGSFYEMYEYRPSDGNRGWGHATELAGILNMILTRKNKAEPHSEDNAYMIGFPVITYEKNRDVMLNANYTLVRIDQTGKSGAKIDRSVAEIVSPATELDSQSGGRLVSIFFESATTGVAKNLDSLLIQAGVSSLEVITGASSVSEFYSSLTYPISAIQDVYRFLVAMNPREIVIYTDGIPESFRTNLGEILDLHRYPMVNWRDTIPSEYRKIPFQLELLSKIFDPPGIKIRRDESFIEQLNLERYQVGRLSYLLLLQYCYEHNPILLKHLSPPEVSWGDSNQHLILTHNAILQLDLLPPRRVDSSPKFDSIYSVINATSTAMGRRYLRDLLVNPLTDHVILNQMYDGVQTFQEQPDLAKQFRDQLRKIGDIQRLHRKVMIGTITPLEISLLIKSYLVMMGLITSVITHPHGGKLRAMNILKSSDIETLNGSMTYIMSRYNLERLEATKKEIDLDLLAGSFLHPGANSHHDQLLTDFQKIYNVDLNHILEHLNSFFKSGKVIEYTEDHQNGFWTTPTRGTTLSKSNVSEGIVGKIEIRAVKNQALITSDRIASILEKFESLRASLREVLVGEFAILVNYLATNLSGVFSTMTRLISYWDVLVSHATIAEKYGYFRPTIVPDTRSFLMATDLRHPLVERLQQYVANDVSLGSENYGILLYGLNSAGKSTLVKSIGINIIMAQMGMFVPSKLRYSPFYHLMTRLSGHDDLLKGQSSFVVEMTELRTILRQSDHRSLVLGDELCRGTESISGASLTLATLRMLNERKVCHIFSTHLHDLPKSSYLPNVKIYHLTTRYDPGADRLIYDRKLQPGSGESLYGLEVARSLHLDPEFLDLTLEIRRSILGETGMVGKKSRYSANVYMRQCLMCGGQQNLQTHHLLEQHLANDHGVINGKTPIRKNSEHNLVVLCSECHQQLHRVNKEISTVSTSDGFLYEESIP